MGPAIVGAVAARGAVARKEQEIFDAKQRELRLKDNARKEKNRQYERELMKQQQAEEVAIKKRLTTWFEKYDADANGLLEAEELRRFLVDVMPNEPPPSDEAVAALLESFPAGINVDEIVRAALRYEAYVTDKKRLDASFKMLDLDGSGLLEKNELARVMADLVGLAEIQEADLDFLYDSLGYQRGEPLRRDAMSVLLPACAEWAKVAKVAAAKAAAEENGGKGSDAKAPEFSGKARSSACVIL